MSDLANAGSDALRKIARRVGELVREHPPLTARLQQAWDDYKVLHLGHIEQTRCGAEHQRQHAIEILKKGFLVEQPRKDDEPSWDWEAFYVRVPKQLLVRRDAERNAVKRAPIIAKLAAATLKYLDWDRRIKACPDKVSGKAMWDRMDAAMPIGKFVCENIRVGFRPRVELSPPPHPLFCKWEEFQTLPLPTRVTVALAVLAVLHDELSAIPVLAPLPRYRDDDPEAQLEAIVSDAVRDCLSVTQPRQGRSEPPIPDPKRLSIERAEAYLSILEAETERLSKMSPNQPTSGSSQTAGARSASALPGPGGPFLFLADNPPSLDGPYWEAPLRNWLLTVAMEVREKMGLIEPSTDARVLAQVRLPLPPLDGARQWLGLIATVFIDGRVPQRDYAAALACFGSGVRDLKWDGPVRPIKVEGHAVHVSHQRGEFVIDAPTLVSYTQNSLRRMAAVSGEPAKSGGGSNADSVDKTAKCDTPVERDALRITRAEAAAAVSQHRTASWISEVTLQDLLPGTLRQMARRGALKNQIKPGGDVLYDVLEVASVKPEFHAALTDALAEGYVAKGRAGKGSRAKKAP